MYLTRRQGSKSSVTCGEGISRCTMHIQKDSASFQIKTHPLKNNKNTWHLILKSFGSKCNFEKFGVIWNLKKVGIKNVILESFGMEGQFRIGAYEWILQSELLLLFQQSVGLSYKGRDWVGINTHGLG